MSGEWPEMMTKMHKLQSPNYSGESRCSFHKCAHNRLVTLKTRNALFYKDNGGRDKLDVKILKVLQWRNAAGI